MQLRVAEKRNLASLSRRFPSDAERVLELLVLEADMFEGGFCPMPTAADAAIFGSDALPMEEERVSSDDFPPCWNLRSHLDLEPLDFAEPSQDTSDASVPES
jgi:hypothetical protein